MIVTRWHLDDDDVLKVEHPTKVTRLHKLPPCRICGSNPVMIEHIYPDGRLLGIGDIRCANCIVNFHFSGKFHTSKKQAAQAWADWAEDVTDPDEYLKREV